MMTTDKTILGEWRNVKTQQADARMPVLVKTSVAKSVDTRLECQAERQLAQLSQMGQPIGRPNRINRWNSCAGSNPASPTTCHEAKSRPMWASSSVGHRLQAAVPAAEQTSQCWTSPTVARAFSRQNLTEGHGCISVCETKERLTSGDMSSGGVVTHSLRPLSNFITP